MTERKKPIDVDERIDECLLILSLALKLKDDRWIGELKERLTDLVELRDCIDTQRKRMERNPYLYEE